jgi:MFS family permease
MKETLANKQPFRLSLLKISGSEIFEPLVWSPVVITFLTYFSYGAILTIIPDFGAYLGITNKGLFFTFFTASSVGIRLLAGKVSDRYGRVPVLKISALMMAGSMLMLGLAGNAALLMAAAVAYGISVGLNSPAVTAWTVDLGKPEHRGRALASMYIAMEAGIGLGAYFSAFIYNNQPGNFPVTFYVFAGITLMATLYLMFIYRVQSPQKIA